MKRLSFQSVSQAPSGNHDSGFSSLCSWETEMGDCSHWGCPGNRIQASRPRSSNCWRPALSHLLFPVFPAASRPTFTHPSSGASLLMPPDIFTIQEGLTTLSTLTYLTVHKGLRVSIYLTICNFAEAQSSF